VDNCELLSGAATREFLLIYPQNYALRIEPNLTDELRSCAKKILERHPAKTENRLIDSLERNESAPNSENENVCVR
jgi:hypothetical protein